MVKIRLTRTGKKGEPHYRVIVINTREKRESKAIEYLGYYNPRSNPSKFEVDVERIKYWLSVGAQPTETVARFLSKQKLFNKIEKKYSKKPGKKTQERNAKLAEKTKATAETKSETKETAAATETPAEVK